MPLADQVGADFRTTVLTAVPGEASNGKTTKTVIEMRSFANNRDFQFSGECIDWISGQLVGRRFSTGLSSGTICLLFAPPFFFPGIRITQTRR